MRLYRSGVLKPKLICPDFSPPPFHWPGHGDGWMPGVKDEAMCCLCRSAHGAVWGVREMKSLNFWIFSLEQIRLDSNSFTSPFLSAYTHTHTHTHPHTPKTQPSKDLSCKYSQSYTLQLSLSKISSSRNTLINRFTQALLVWYCKEHWTGS